MNAARSDLSVKRSALNVERSESTAAAVDSANPWPGLASFTEAQSRLFHGRNEEVAELGRRVQRKLLTVLFGQSGLGKTSILRAGVVPKLRAEGYCPVYVRIDYGRDGPPPAEQVRRAIAQALDERREREGVETTSPDAAGSVTAETLWEFLHHRDESLRDSTGRALIPLLIFDQFEEIFTLAQSDDFGRERAALFKEELADLVENRAPKTVEAKFERDEAAAERFDFARADYRILIALREDYLAHLEGLKAQMPSVTQNRMRLARMTGTQALSAVMGPGGELVHEEVAQSIVRFVAGVAELEHAEVEPSLLSLVCRELNNTRLAQGRAEISADLLAGSRETILSEFYERTLADQPAGVRTFVEDELLTDSGYRESTAEERARKALAAAGAPPEALSVLVDRRLLRMEERLDVRRVELTHDVLCNVVAASRAVRHQREEKEAAERQLAATQAQEAATRRSLRKARAVAAAAVTLSGFAIAAAVFGYVNMKRAERASAVAAAAETKAETTSEMADRARGQAEKLVGFLLDDFYEELSTTAGLELVRSLAEQAIAYYDGLPAELQSIETRRNRALALLRQGAVLRGQGVVVQGNEIIDRAAEEFERLHTETPSAEIAMGLAEALLAQASGVVALGANPRASRVRGAAMDRAGSLLRPLAEKADASIKTKLRLARFLVHPRVNNELTRANAQEARAILGDVGARDLSNLTAASLYARATIAMANTSPDQREDLYREAAEIAGKVLAQSPGDLNAAGARAGALSYLAGEARNRLDYAEQLKLWAEAEAASGYVVRLDPGNLRAWEKHLTDKLNHAYALRQLGRITEMKAIFRSVVGLARDERSRKEASLGLAVALGTAASSAALAGDISTARHLDEEARALRQIIYEKRGASETERVLGEVRSGQSTRTIKFAGGDYEGVIADCRITLKRIDEVLAQPGAGRTLQRELNGERASAYRHIMWSETMLGRFAAAEAASREGNFSAAGIQNLSSAAVTAETFWLALAVAKQGRVSEALQVMEPAMKVLRERRARGEDSLQLREHLARALYLEAICQPDSPVGRASRAAKLQESAEVLAALPAEALDTFWIRLVRGWLDEEKTRAAGE